MHAHEDHDHGAHAQGIRGLFAKLFGHSHDVAGVSDTALEASAEGIRALKRSLVALGITAALQFVVVAASGSVALLADSIHNLSDALTAVPLWIAFWIGRRPATARYTYGYGRAEDLAGVFVVAMIALSAVIAGWEAIDRFRHPREVRHVGWVIAAGVIGFIGNELVAVYRIRVGTKIGSAALVADGMHARTDGFTSLGVVAGGIGVLAGFEDADPIVGILITIAILFVLRSAGLEIYRRLMDGVDPDLSDAVREVLLGVPGVDDVDSIRLRWIGHRLRAEVELVSEASLSLIEAHAIADRAHDELLARVPRLWEAVIHTSPAGIEGRPHG